jgi:hypothetical protein
MLQPNVCCRLDWRQDCVLVPPEPPDFYPSHHCRWHYREWSRFFRQGWLTFAKILIILFMLLRCIFCGCGPRKKNKRGAVAPARTSRRQHGQQLHAMSQYNSAPLPPPPSHPANQRHSVAPDPYPSQYNGNQQQSWNNQGHSDGINTRPGTFYPPPPPPQRQSGGGWVDPSTYNGPNYSYQQEQQQYGQYR